jgi:hypothetical protein
MQDVEDAESSTRHSAFDEQRMQLSPASPTTKASVETAVIKIRKLKPTAPPQSPIMRKISFVPGWTPSRPSRLARSMTGPLPIPFQSPFGTNC